MLVLRSAAMLAEGVVYSLTGALAGPVRGAGRSGPPSTDPLLRDDGVPPSSWPTTLT